MIRVWITTDFTAFHRWEDAPEEVQFLREWHRHLFKVKVELKVTHSDRDVEFLILKRKVDQYINLWFAHSKFEYSCEHIAESLLDHFDAYSVTVSEDGENGATVTNE